MCMHLKLDMQITQLDTKPKVRVPSTAAYPPRRKKQSWQSYIIQD